MLRVFLVAILVVGNALAALADQPATELGPKEALAKELEKFAATWEFISVQPDGATKGARWVVFNKDGTYTALDPDGKELWAGTYEIDPTAKPKIWDHRSHALKADGRDILGIYEFDGDLLHACCVVGEWDGKTWIGKPRPKEFALDEADVVLKLRRAKATIK